MADHHFDVVVLGGGFGGMCAAARLVHNGYKTLLVERMNFLGGRTSSLDYDGFQISTGAMGIPGGGIIEETYREVGAEFIVRRFEPEMVFRIEGKDYEWPVEEGLAKAIYEYARDKEGAQRLLDAFARAVTWQFPFGTMSLKDWISQYTRDERVHQVFQPFSIALLGTNINEMPVSEFFAWIAQSQQSEGGYLSYAHKGNAAFLEPLERAIEEKGGEIWKNTEVTKILVEQYHVTGVVIRTPEGEKVISARAVISNLGPKMTIEMAGKDHFDQAYLAEVERIKPTPMIVIANIISDEPFFHHQGLVWPIGNPHLICLITPTNCCPEMAPPGKHILQSYSGIMEPRSEVDAKHEIELNLGELYKMIPEAETRGEVLSAGCWHKAWPLFHTDAYALPQKTPVVHLYNTGDGVRIPGLIGVSLCAETARVVVGDLMSRIAPGEEID